jgi:hypothetical protein
MSYNLLQLVQQTTAELNLAVPTYVIGNPTQDVQQVFLDHLCKLCTYLHGNFPLHSGGIVYATEQISLF